MFHLVAVTSVLYGKDRVHCSLLLSFLLCQLLCLLPPMLVKRWFQDIKSSNHPSTKQQPYLPQWGGFRFFHQRSHGNTICKVKLIRSFRYNHGLGDLNYANTNCCQLFRFIKYGVLSANSCCFVRRFGLKLAVVFVIYIDED